MNIGPATPKTVEIDICTYGAPETIGLGATPVERHINAVAVHKSSVSI